MERIRVQAPQRAYVSLLADLAGPRLYERNSFIDAVAQMSRIGSVVGCVLARFSVLGDRLDHMVQLHVHLLRDLAGPWRTPQTASELFDVLFAGGRRLFTRHGSSPRSETRR